EKFLTFEQEIPNFKISKTPVSPNLKKIKNKIKTVFDDDDDEEEEITVFFSLMPEETDSPLINALKEDEKKKLLINQTLSNQKMLETAGKMEALITADKMSKQMGLKGLRKKILRDGIQDVALNTETLDRALKDDISLKTNIHTENLSLRESVNLARGMRRMQQAALVSEDARSGLKNMDAEDLVDIGKSKDEKKVAEKILVKSGRKESKSFEDKNASKKKIRTAVRQAPSREREL
ncbi:MAG: hypothetical protein MJ210_04705, partial [Alphaproteobacteria bacterium]|nr:hypothetical protein [Alphaproteobacteria bacterium]